MKPIFSHILRISLLFFVLSGFFSTAAYATVDVDLEISLDKEDIKTGDSFSIDATITNIDSNDNLSSDKDDIELIIYFDGVIVYEDDSLSHSDLDYNESQTFTTRSSKFNDDWEDESGKLIAYMCKSNIDINVDITGDVSGSQEIDFLVEGKELEIGIEPMEPTAEDEITISVEDKVGNELDYINVRLTHLGSDDEWNSEDSMRVKDTANGKVVFSALSGDLKFKADPYGLYQLDVWADKYCLETKTFEVKNILKITGVPGRGYTGNEIRVRVLSREDKAVENAKIGVSGPSGFVGSYNSDSSGYVRFTIKDSGSYTLIATKSGFSESSVVSLEVINKEGVDIRIEPVKQAVGRDVSITVTTSGDPINGAEVIIKKPDGSKDTLSTSSVGKIIYKPTDPGIYDITVEKEGYETTTSSFTATNFFDVTVPDEPGLYSEVTLIVRNQEGIGLSDVSVIIEGSSVRGSTDSNGEFSFILDTAGEYQLSIKKEGYEDFRGKITIYGKLHVNINPETLDLGDSVTLTVLDEQSERIEADIVITNPGNIEEKVRKISHTFVPGLAGTYNVTVNRKYYTQSASSISVFYVNPSPLDLDVWVSGKDLSVKATSRGEPVEGLNLSILTPGGVEVLISTDSSGLAVFGMEDLNQTGLFTVNSVDLNYEKKTVKKEVKGLGVGMFSLLLLGVGALAVVAGIAFFVVYKDHKKKKSEHTLIGSKKKKKKSRGIGLGGL